MTTESPRARRPKNTTPDAHARDAMQADAAPDTIDAPDAAPGVDATEAAVADADVVYSADVADDDSDEELMGAPATRPLPAAPADDWLLESAPAPLIPPQATGAHSRASFASAASEDPEATTQRPAVSGPEGGSRPRWNTLAGAVMPAGPRLRLSDSQPLAPLASDSEVGEVGEDEQATAALAPIRQSPVTPPAMNALPPTAAPTDEIADELDEWSIADQPTVQLTPQMLPALAEQARQAKLDARRGANADPSQEPRRERPRPSFLDTDEHQSWPPRANPASGPLGQATPPARGLADDQPGAANMAPAAPSQPRPPARDGLRNRPGTPVGPVDPRRVPPSTAGEPRLASPTGRPMPVPPQGVSKAEMSNPRMRRFQELHRQRSAHERGEQDPKDAPQFGQAMRQWWSDLRPGLASGLEYQHEARASGTHPIPAYDPAPPVSRLGDAFGRLARTARELTERAQSAAGPRIKQLHDQVEQAAQGIVDRFEGNPARQQAPFLGPGRIAIFFRQGVTVGQAQRLMTASAARPMRLIPRKHGFLARVRPGAEAATCDALRRHPYVRDVAYLEYDEYGQPLDDEE